MVTNPDILLTRFLSFNVIHSLHSFSSAFRIVRQQRVGTLGDFGGGPRTYIRVVDNWPTEEVPLCSNTCHLLLLLIGVYRVDYVY